MIGTDGFISLEAIRWLQRLGIALIHLDRDGNMLATSARTAGDARLRRLQAPPPGARPASRSPGCCCRRSSTAKPGFSSRSTDGGEILASFEAATRVSAAANARRAASRRSGTPPSPTGRPGSASRTFPAPTGSLVPEHWLVFGQRGSLLTSSPRLAINPANAIFNYLYALLEAETRFACLIVGLDPGLGIVHVDYREPRLLRPRPDGGSPTSRRRLRARASPDPRLQPRDFAETARGVCRINPPLSHELSETAPQWAEAVAPAAEAVAQLLASSQGSSVKEVSTPLTGRSRSARYDGKRRAVATRTKTPARAVPTCKRCDGPLPRLSRTYCDGCLPHYQREQYERAFHGSGLAVLEEKKADGADPTHSAAAAARRAEANIIRKRQAREWDERHGKLVDLSPSDATSSR